MNECQNCGVKNQDDAYHCQSCGYPIQGSYEERAKFSMGGGQWKMAVDGKADEIQESFFNKRIQIGLFVLLIMFLTHLLMVAGILALGRSPFVETGAENMVVVVLSLVAIAEVGLYFLPPDRRKTGFTLALIIRGSIILISILYCSTVNKEMRIEWILLWFVAEGFIITYLIRAMDASAQLERLKATES